jgi:hypothetical protein
MLIHLPLDADHEEALGDGGATKWKEPESLNHFTHQKYPPWNIT